ncbi:MAG: hypothetical protein OQJ99_01450 [Rhodospirillales bacterium]|nr:hypothetical protein [Rhodospirillales bacterium]MCW8861742.1 hypothetical protein [Rhodospirillales bacterium]MCW8951656.1 hypothetical protein [Rhodospirillales bacterium]MCW8970098.1 hypothetical protein [Rhodospirillales bacterium]MCW9001608.1 hypothetical protein [Rhodospirillales bacterium]
MAKPFFCRSLETLELKEWRGVMNRLATIAFCLALVACDDGRTVHSDVPRNIDPAVEYLFFLGETGSGDAEKRIAETLSGKALQVIAPPRTAADDPDLFALGIKEGIRQMLARGVPGNHIAIAGIGEGGRITLLAMALLRDPAISYVIIDACPAPDTPGAKTIESIAAINAHVMEGRLLSIHAGQGSCGLVLERASAAETWEVVVEGGRVSDPAAPWIGELLGWIKG